MRRNIIAIVVFIAILISGCSALSAVTVPETLKSWSFQYNDGTEDYSVFFALLDKQGKYISYDVFADIKIVDEEENILFTDTKSVTEKDFGYYTSDANGEQYLANIKIPADNIQSGTSNCGTVYLTIYKDDIVDFGEVNCRALYCLPVKDVSVAANNLPVEVEVKEFDGTTASIIKIESISYEFNKDYMSLEIILVGEKIYGQTNGYDMFTCKLYDSEGYLIQTQNIYLNSLNIGDRFKDNSFITYDVIPGENYTVQIESYSW